MTPKGNIGCFRQGYFATMKCVVVNKAFKKAAEEQRKIKQLKRQLKALGYDSKYADQTADVLNNTCQTFDHF